MDWEVIIRREEFHIESYLYDKSEDNGHEFLDKMVKYQNK